MEHFETKKSAGRNCQRSFKDDLMTALLLNSGISRKDCEVTNCNDNANFWLPVLWSGSEIRVAAF